MDNGKTRVRHVERYWGWGIHLSFVFFILERKKRVEGEGEVAHKEKKRNWGCMGKLGIYVCDVSIIVLAEIRYLIRFIRLH